MRIQHFGAGFFIFQDIYDIRVLMHEFILHAKNGLYLNKKVGHLCYMKMGKG